MARAPLLDLSTLVDDRPAIRIDGEIYHLKSPEELSLLESQQFTDWGKDLEELAADPGKRKALEEQVGVVAWAVFADLPAAVFDKLSGVQRMDVVDLFTGLLLGRRLRLAGVLGGQIVSSRPTGEKSSPGSSASSAASPDTGSPKSPPRSSGPT